MNKKLEVALEYCRQAGLDKVVFIIPFELGLQDILELKSLPVCSGMVLNNPPAAIANTASDDWLGDCSMEKDWRLPSAKGALLFVGAQILLTRKMAMRALLSGRSAIICKANGSYHKLAVRHFFISRMGSKLRRSISLLPRDSLLRKYLYGIATTRQVKKLWWFIFNRKLSNSGLDGEALYQELLGKAMLQPKEALIAPVAGRVILVNAGLAAGGAERQIVNTLIGLRNSGRCESVSLLAEYIDHVPHLNFFLHELEQRGIAVTQMQHDLSLDEDGVSSLPESIVELAADLPSHILEDILNLVEEFRRQRPSIVHAWQDTTSLKAGIAAVIAGVPRIILASRNVTPVHFTYYEDSMRPAYRALAALNCVVMLNNSDAGAVDYTSWLGLPRERFVVVRNGVNLDYLKRAEGQLIRDYRKSLGIPENAKVVGSVFRFWAEKRPMLWVKATALLAKKFPEVHFLLIGEGPMRHEMEAFISSRGLKRQFHLPGTRADVALPLSAMNVFLLTSEFEGTPNVVLEAQWMGLPVVATDAGGTRESFANDITGSLATDASPEEIALLLEAYLENEEKMTKAAQHGPEFVARTFGLEQMVQKTLELYELAAKTTSC